MPTKYDQIKERIRTSAFNTFKDTGNYSLIRLNESILTTSEKIIDGKIVRPVDHIDTKNLTEFTAPFQRDCNKWTEDMQVSFIENLIDGASTTITLYSLSADKTGCRILDGQHRVNAILKFIEGDLIVYKGLGGMKFQELKDNRVINAMNPNVRADIITFENERAAANYYIQINRNMTHANEDIIRAEKFITECDKSSTKKNLKTIKKSDDLDFN